MPTHVAHRNRHIRQKAMREQLSTYGLIQQVQVLVEKIEHLGEKPVLTKDELNELDFELRKYKTAADLKMRLINKYLSDAKPEEGEEASDRPTTEKETQWIVDATGNDSA